jgi:uncharacterized protein (DUF362 family)
MSPIDSIKNILGRRDFLKTASLGTAALSLGAFGIAGCASQLPKSRRTGNFGKTIVETGESRVNLITGNDRRKMIIESLEPFREQIRQSIEGKKVFIKVNCVWQDTPLIATHPDSIKAVLDFLKPIYNRPVYIGESSASDRGMLRLFEEYSYTPLARDYNIKFLDLSEQGDTACWILDKNLYPTPVRIINTFLDPDYYIISLTRLKTHNVVVTTLTLKNVVMGSPMKNVRLKIQEKSKMHANGEGNNSPKMLNFNLFIMAHRVHPDFCILDGYEGVQGNGPTEGYPVDHRVALAGSDFVAVDRIGSELMGVPWENIGYLQYCALAGLGQGDRSKIKVLGENPSNHIINYKLHKNIEWQLTWKDDMTLLEKIKPTW